MLHFCVTLWSLFFFLNPSITEMNSMLDINRFTKEIDDMCVLMIFKAELVLMQSMNVHYF